MKLHSFWVHEYRVLKKAGIALSPSRAPAGAERTAEGAPRHALDLLVGINGTGKSTALRMVVNILRRIEQGESVDDLRFRISYEPEEGRLVTVTNVGRGGERVSGELFAWEGGPDTPPRMRRPPTRLSPGPFVLYTTGREEERLPWTGRHTREQLQAAADGPYWLQEQPDVPALPPPPPESADEGTQSRYFEVGAQDLPLASLCGLLYEQSHPARSKAMRSALDNLRIRGMTGFTLRLRTDPGSSDSRLSKWLHTLRAAASRTRVHGSEVLFVFDVRAGSGAALGALNALCSAFGAADGDAADLLRKMAAESRSPGGARPALAPVDLFIERAREGRRTPDLHRYEWLSDGERTFLARVAILTVFAADGALILMDEPEVHFNDAWKRKLVRLVDEALRQHHSHAIITTHSSIVLTDARTTQINVLQRDSNGRTGDSVQPKVNTYAADPSDVLVGVFGADDASGAKGGDEVRALLRDYWLTLRAAQDHDEEQLDELRQRLRALKSELAPGYWRFRVADALEPTEPSLASARLRSGRGDASPA